MKVSDFRYELPPELIAQEPSQPRDAARLLVHAIAAAQTLHSVVRELPELLAPGDLVVMNDTRVLPARLHARRSSGGRVELLFTHPLGDGRWRAMVNPARKLHPDEELEAADGALRVRALDRPADATGRPRLRRPARRAA